MVFLVETDSNSVNNETDYKLPGFKTVIQKKEHKTNATKIICLVGEKLCTITMIRLDLSTTEFLSIWIELKMESGRNILCEGFYREWAPTKD